MGMPIVPFYMSHIRLQIQHDTKHPPTSARQPTASPSLHPSPQPCLNLEPCYQSTVNRPEYHPTQPTLASLRDPRWVGCCLDIQLVEPNRLSGVDHPWGVHHVNQETPAPRVPTTHTVCQLTHEKRTNRRDKLPLDLSIHNPDSVRVLFWNYVEANNSRAMCQTQHPMGLPQEVQQCSMAAAGPVGCTCMCMDWLIDWLMVSLLVECCMLS